MIKTSPPRLAARPAARRPAARRGPALAPTLALPLTLALTLLGGCATEPPVPGRGTALDEAAAAAAAGAELTEDYRGAPVSDIARFEAGLPPVSQKVDPLPPDPASLPEPGKRQLDIRLAAQRFNYFEDDQLVWSGLISSGAAQHPTPRGSYRLQSKVKNKRSGSYTNFFNMPTPMPYALQFKGPYWIHEGYLPGVPASHGCVRLRYEDARFVYERMRIGDRIVIAD